MAKAEQNLYSRIGPLAALFGLIILAGGLGFRLIEGWSWSESIYMAIITVSTVGYGEVHPLSIHGKLFTACAVNARLLHSFRSDFINIDFRPFGKV